MISRRIIAWWWVVVVVVRGPSPSPSPSPSPPPSSRGLRAQYHCVVVVVRCPLWAARSLLSLFVFFMYWQRRRNPHRDTKSVCLCVYA